MLAAFRLSETGGRDAQARDHHDDDARTRSAQGDSGRGRPRPGGLARGRETRFVAASGGASGAALSRGRPGRVELWADGASLPYTTYDRLGEIDQAAIVENKRLGHVLAIAAQVQALRDSRHQAGPSRTLSGEPPRPARVPLNVKRQRLINRLDLERALAAAPLHPRAADILSLPAAGQPPHSASDSVASGQRHRPTNRPRKEHGSAQKARSH